MKFRQKSTGVDKYHYSTVRVYIIITYLHTSNTINNILYKAVGVPGKSFNFWHIGAMSAFSRPILLKLQMPEFFDSAPDYYSNKEK